MNADATFEEYRSLLFALAYRMLGSCADAEDCLQDAYLRWHAATEGRADSIHAPRTYLCTLVTNICIDHLRSAKVRRETYVGVWLPEPLVASDATPEPDATAELDETISLAFLLLLERLTPTERAIFLLHDVFEYNYNEIAAMLRKSAENCRQIAHRAQQSLAAQRPRFDPDRGMQQRLIERFAAACASGDMHGLIGLLSEDIVLHSDGGGKVQAALKPIFGPEKVARMLIKLAAKFPADMRATLARVNGAKGIVLYSDATDMDATVLAVVTLTTASDQIQQIAIMVNPDKLRHVLVPDQSI